MAADRDEGPARCSAAPVSRVVDTTGAGDAFNAAFLVARDRGASLAAALQQASAVAAQVIGRMGARSAWFTQQPDPRNSGGKPMTPAAS
jgi:ribokinase/sulfofructose kinase